jgi:general secretion pathway protein H
MRRHLGFTMIEMVIVVVLIAAVIAIVAGVVHRQMPGSRLRASAQQLAAQLRYTRAQAIASGETRVFTLDARSREWHAGGKREGRLARDIAIVAVGARNEQQREGVAAVRFFPEGAATGGRFTLSNGDAAWQVDVQWLTGEVSVARTRAP